jgi:putative ABC transport system permease protein
MAFVALILKNLVRQPIRTGLTLLGISIGITTVVALGVITTSLKKTSGEIIQFGGADFMVVQKGAADLSFSSVPEEDADALALREDVAWAEGMLFHIARVGSNPFFFLLGRRAEDVAANPPSLRDGRVFEAGATDELMLGYRAADSLDVGVGDSVTIDPDRPPFRVVGIYRTGTLYSDSGGMARIETVQEIAAKANVVTAVFVKVKPGEDARAIADQIEDAFPNLSTISDVSEYGKVDQGVEFLDAANLAISVLAVGIGAIGVMNTMVMSVFERRREIGILRAVGWSSSRILRMIIGESIVLCVVAAGVGAVLGLLAIQGVLLFETVRNLLEPAYTLDVFVRGVVVAVVVALLGAAYPAFHAVRQTPLEALRYE